MSVFSNGGVLKRENEVKHHAPQETLLTRRARNRMCCVNKGARRLGSAYLNHWRVCVPQTVLNRIQSSEAYKL